MISVRCGDNYAPFFVTPGRFKSTIVRSSIIQLLQSGQLTIKQIVERGNLKGFAIRREITRMKKEGLIEKIRVPCVNGAMYEWRLL